MTDTYTVVTWRYLLIGRYSGPDGAKATAVRIWICINDLCELANDPDEILDMLILNASTPLHHW
jgi:hypothetical protein